MIILTDTLFAVRILFNVYTWPGKNVRAQVRCAKSGQTVRERFVSLVLKRHLLYCYLISRRDGHYTHLFQGDRI